MRLEAAKIKLKERIEAEVVTFIFLITLQPRLIFFQKKKKADIHTDFLRFYFLIVGQKKYSFERRFGEKEEFFRGAPCLFSRRGIYLIYD